MWLVAPATPTVTPTFAPTMQLNPQATFVTSSLGSLNIEYPIAQHQLVVVQPAGNSLIQLTFFDAFTTKVASRIFHHVIITNFFCVVSIHSSCATLFWNIISTFTGV